MLEWTKYRRERGDAVRNMTVRLVPASDLGDAEWKTEASRRDELRRIVDEVRTCRHRTQAAIAKALGVPDYTITRIKHAAITAGLITNAEWKECMSACESMAETDF